MNHRALLGVTLLSLVLAAYSAHGASPAPTPISEPTPTNEASAAAEAAEANETDSTTPNEASDSADDAPPASGPVDELTGEPITVWATEISSSSVYLHEDEIALRQVDHLSDLLRTLPGVDVGGTHSTNQRINIRGLGDRDLEITLDGAVQNNYMYHHMGNLLLNTDILKAVDVQVGAGSIVDGGLGGAVRFETKDAADLLLPGQTFGGRGQAVYNSNSSVSVGATAFAQLSDSVDLLLYGQQVDRDDFEDGRGTPSSGNDGTTDNLLLKLGIQLSEGHRLELSLDDLQDDGLYAPRPDFNGAANDRINEVRNGTKYPTSYGRQTLTLGYEANLGNTLLRSSVYSNDSELEREENTNLVNGQATNEGLNLIFHTTLPGAGAAHHLTYGARSNRLESLYALNDAVTDIEEATGTAIFIEDRIQFSDRWTVTPGVRFDRYAMDTSSSDETFDEVSFALSTEIGLSDSWNLQLSGTELFKGPELAEIFIGGGGRKIPNPDLRPESGINLEASVRFQRADVLGADRLSAHLTFFQTDIDHYIESVSVAEGCTIGARCSQDQNVGTLELDGFEAGLHFIRGGFSGLLTYASSDSWLPESERPLERELGDSLSLTLAYNIPQYDLELSWSSQVVFEEDRVAAGSPAKDGYEVHDLAAKWRATKVVPGLSLTVGIDNLFDELYASHASRYLVNPVFGDLTDFEPGRNFKTTLSYAF